MKFIRWLFGGRKKSNVYFKNGSQNGHPIAWALSRAYTGDKVSRIQWPVGDYLLWAEYEYQYVCAKSCEVTRYKVHYKSADYVSCDWYIFERGER